MKKLAIFDLDGTLLHTVPDLTDQINVMLSHFGYKNRTEKEVASFVGCGARNLVRLSVPATLSEEELSERLNFYNTSYTGSGSPKTRLFDGISELLFALKNAGVYLAIMTNKPQETTDAVYEKYLKQFCFDKVVGASENVKCKPDKTATENLIKEFAVEKENVFFIGDGETDAITAINAGVNGISVLWGYRSREQLLEAGAKTFVQNPNDVLEIITPKKV